MMKGSINSGVFAAFSHCPGKNSFAMAKTQPCVQVDSRTNVGEKKALRKKSMRIGNTAVSRYTDAPERRIIAQQKRQRRDCFFKTRVSLHDFTRQ